MTVDWLDWVTYPDRDGMCSVCIKCNQTLPSDAGWNPANYHDCWDDEDMQNIIKEVTSQ